MAFATTWSEELVAECLALEGYIVETNVPIGAGRGGGRKEADVVGVRFKNGIVNIVHVEVGSLASGPSDVLERYRNKFMWGKEGLEKHFGVKMDKKENINFEQRLVATWSSGNTIEIIKNNLPKIKFLTIKTLLEEKIMSIVNQRVKQNKVFPANYWLLNLLWYINRKEINLK